MSSKIHAVIVFLSTEDINSNCCKCKLFFFKEHERVATLYCIKEDDRFQDRRIEVFQERQTNREKTK